jgi:signal transduction histidine kinase
MAGGNARLRAIQTTARLDDLSRLLPDWIWETDRDLRLTYVGDRITDVLYYHPHQFIDQPVWNLFGPDLPLERSRRGGSARPFRDCEVTVADHCGAPHVLNVAALPLFDDGSARFSGYLGIARDVTESKAQARAIMDAKAAADRANEAKSNFLATMSHELRTPLNAIMGFADVMQGQYFGPLGHPKYHEYSADILASARHLAQMIDDVLDMAKIEAGRLHLNEERVPADDLMDRAVRMVKPKADAANLVLRLAYPNKRVELNVDGHKLVQVLVNLLANAVKFTDPEGKIELTGALMADGSFEFIVEDTGIGMSADDQILALEPFHQVDVTSQASREGAGLGLSIVKALVELHDGTLKVDSEVGFGTRMTVILKSGRVTKTT